MSGVECHCHLLHVRALLYDTFFLGARHVHLTVEAFGVVVVYLYGAEDNVFFHLLFGENCFGGFYCLFAAVGIEEGDVYLAIHHRLDAAVFA